MTNPANPFQPAIEALEKDLVDLERQWNALSSAINVLRDKAGLPPRHPSGPGPGHMKGATDGVAPTISSIRGDTFYGKTMGAATREFLEMRLAQNLGPATPREIFEALKAGGFPFGSKDETNSMVILRALLRKRSQIFHKLPNTGSYGLKKWYPNAPNAKPSKVSASEAEPEAPRGTSEADLKRAGALPPEAEMVKAATG